MSFPKKLKDLCAPSMLYFMISIIAFFVALFQNLGNTDTYLLGDFSCKVPSTILIFTVKLIYIMFWTWILNLICKDGYTGISWLLVLFPFILLFVIMGLILLNK
jgi:hypothetical protein